MRTLNCRTAILFILLSLFAAALYVVSSIYYQNFSFASNRNEHVEQMRGIMLNIAHVRKYRSYDLLSIRSPSELNLGKISSKSDVNVADHSSNTQECIPLDYSQCDRVIWSGSDSERKQLYSDLALYAEHHCYRDSPEYLWRFAVALYYSAALQSSSVAVSDISADHSGGIRDNQIALLSRANVSINRARELTRNMDPRVLKWYACASLSMTHIYSERLSSLQGYNTWSLGFTITIREFIV